MRDHQKLKAFALADDLVVNIYKITKLFPTDERFGLTAQIRRASVSIASNIVEGCARSSKLEYLHFLDIAYGSAQEVEYQLSLAHRLEHIEKENYDLVKEKCSQSTRVLNALIRSLKNI